MPWWTWVALAAFVVAVLGGLVALVIMLLRTFRRLQTAQRGIIGALDELARTTEELEGRLAAVGRRSEEIEQHFARLRASLDKLSALNWALGDARDMISRLRSAVPRK